MKNGNTDFGTGNGLKDISQMGMAGGNFAGQPSGNKMPNLEKYKKPAILAIGGLLVLVVLFIVIKALFGGGNSQKDYDEAASFEEAALYLIQVPITKKELDGWASKLHGCYPPEATEIFNAIYSFGKELATNMEEVKEDYEEEYELVKKMMAGVKVSDSRRLDEEECEECEALIDENYDISIDIDDGYLVEVEMDSKVIRELSEEWEVDLAAYDTKYVFLVLRSGKYTGTWTMVRGQKLDEIGDLERDFYWEKPDGSTLIF